MSMVNAERREGAITSIPSNSNKSEQGKSSIISELFLKFREKEMRSNFNNSIQKFLTSLIRISEKLKEVSIENRDEDLKKKVKMLNRWIRRNREAHHREKDNPFAYYYEGIMFPFENNSDSNQIVHIIKEESFSFTTRKRVPYKITFETIKYFQTNIQQR